MLQRGRHCDVCHVCQIWALNLDLSSFGNAVEQAGLGRGGDCIPVGYFSSSPPHQCFFLCDINHCLHWNHTSLSLKGNTLLYLTVAFKTVCLCLSDCGSMNPLSHLVILTNIHCCLVFNWLHGDQFVASCAADKYNFSLLCTFCLA